MLRDGVPLIVGLNRVTAFATPGHTTGSASWVIHGCGTKVCPAIAYTDSTSAISADGYRFSDHLGVKAEYTIERGRQTGGGSRDNEDFFGTEAVFKF